MWSASESLWRSTYQARGWVGSISSWRSLWGRSTAAPSYASFFPRDLALFFYSAQAFGQRKKHRSTVRAAGSCAPSSSGKAVYGTCPAALRLWHAVRVAHTRLASSPRFAAPCTSSAAPVCSVLRSPVTCPCGCGRGSAASCRDGGGRRCKLRPSSRRPAAVRPTAPVVDLIMSEPH